MNTTELMQLALELAGMTEVPTDSAIYHPGEGLRKVIIGIDMGVPELLLARDLGCDGVIAHHPNGDRARIDFAEVLWTHLDQMLAHGVPDAVARPIVEEKVESMRFQLHAANYDHAPSAARLLDMPYLNIHLPLDEVGRVKMVQSVKKLKPSDSVEDLIARFTADMPEFQLALTDFQVRVGRLENRLGKVAVSHAAGTNGGYAIAKAYFDHGVDTVLYIHCSPQDSLKLRQECDGKGKNLVISGHIASDAVGINAYADALEDQGLEVVRMSGVLR